MAAGHEVELVKGGGGVFEIAADGRSLFSKRDLRRFPTDEEIDAIARG